MNIKDAVAELLAHEKPPSTPAEAIMARLSDKAHALTSRLMLFGEAPMPGGGAARSVVAPTGNANRWKVKAV